MKAHVPELSWTWLLLLPLIVAMLLVTAYPVGLIFLKSFVASRPGQSATWGLQFLNHVLNHVHILSRHTVNGILK